MHNLTQLSTTNTQQELVTQVPASLVTTKATDQGIPLPPPPRGFTPPTKRILPAKSTEHIAEALKEVNAGTRTNGTHNEEIQKVPTKAEH